MGNYSIKQLEKLSGVKSHTIRIWEQRYGLLEPKRTASNIRYYDDIQLKKLLNIAILNNNGHKISKISDYSAEQMQRALLKVLDGDHHAKNEDNVNGLIVSMLNVDERRFDHIMNDCFEHYGFLETIENIIYPFLFKVGVMWGLDEISPPQEHFMSNLIRHRIIAEISKLDMPEEDKERFVLFLPENELHEVGLLLANYQIRKLGFRVIYLGQTTPFEHLSDIVHITKAENLLTFFIKQVPREFIQNQINTLSKSFPASKIYVTGRDDLLYNIKFPSNVTYLKNPRELIECLTKK